MAKQDTSEWESLAHKTTCCPLLSEGDDWGKLATALSLSVLLQYEDIVSHWRRYGDKNQTYPICQWLQGKMSTEEILALSKK